jgi:hypothetical protein
MSTAARRQLQRRARRYHARFLRFALPCLPYVLPPFDNPRKKCAPRGAAELLNEIRPAA